MGLFDGEGSIFEGVCGTAFLYIIIGALFIFFILKFSKEFLGVAPFQAWAMTRKPPKWKDIEANAHPRLIDKLVREAKDSWDHRSKYLALMSLDVGHYPTVERNTIRVGKVRGAGFYRDYHVIIVRTSWRWKKMVFLAPPDALLSSSGVRTLVYEGTGVKATGFTDILYPSPSKDSDYSPQAMYDFIDRVYNIELAGVKRVLKLAMAADLEMRATQPSAVDRRAIELGRDLTERSSRGDIEASGGDEQNVL
jgi:hypothetical protein